MEIKLIRLPPSKCTGVLSSPTMAPPPYITILSLMSLTPDQSHIGTRQSVNGTKKIVFSNCTKAVNSSILQKVKLTLMPEHVSQHLLKRGGSKHVYFGGKQLHLWYMIFAESSRAWTMWGSFQGIRLQQRAFPLPAEHSGLAVHLQDETRRKSHIQICKAHPGVMDVVFSCLLYLSCCSEMLVGRRGKVQFFSLYHL